MCGGSLTPLTALAWTWDTCLLHPIGQSLVTWSYLTERDANHVSSFKSNDRKRRIEFGGQLAASATW